MDERQKRCNLNKCTTFHAINCMYWLPYTTQNRKTPPFDVREQDPSGLFISIYNSSSFLPSSSSFLFPSELGINFNEGNHTLIPINHVHVLRNEWHRNYSHIPYWHGNHTHILTSEVNSQCECESTHSSEWWELISIPENERNFQSRFPSFKGTN